MIGAGARSAWQSPDVTVPRRYSFTRYLAAKRPIDDRSLNRPVWEALVDSLRDRCEPEPAHILELGAGIGTMVERAWEWGLAPRAAYTAVDSSATYLFAARRHLSGWARRSGIDRHDGATGRQRFHTSSADWSLDLRRADAFDVVRRTRRRWDLIIGHAFVDLIDLSSGLPRLLSVLPPDGLFYFSLAFDGATILEPLVDRQLDEHIERLYHQTMDRRTEGGKPSGDSQTGRHLPAAIEAAGGEVSQMGASDWVVSPRRRMYLGDEAYFLHFIVHTIANALRSTSEIPAPQLRRWVQARHRQIERGELTYIAHQLDVLGRML